jgi:hypothetical protein
MKNRSRLFTLACVSMLLLLSACDDTKGWGESEGFGGYTKGFGDVKGYGNEEVGLCTYLGGCMPDESESTTAAKRSTDKSGDHAGDHHGSVDDTGTH